MQLKVVNILITIDIIVKNYDLTTKNKSVW